MALPGFCGARRPTKASVRLTMPINVAPYPTAPNKATIKEPSNMGNTGSTMDTICKPKASNKARTSPRRRATLSHKNTPGMAASPTKAQANAPCPASAGSRSTMATVKVALITKPQPAAK